MAVVAAAAVTLMVMCVWCSLFLFFQKYQQQKQKRPKIDSKRCISDEKKQQHPTDQQMEGAQHSLHYLHMINNATHATD